DRLSGSCIQTQLGAAHHDTRANEIGEGRELSAGQIPEIDPMPFALDEQDLIGCKRPNALGEFGTTGDGLASDSIHYAEHVPGAMVARAREEVQPSLVLVEPFLVLFAFGNILYCADQAHRPPLIAAALELNKSLHLHPADPAVSPLNPVLMRGARR